MALIYLYKPLLHRPSPRADEIQRVAFEIPPEYAQKLRVFAQPHTAAARRDDKCKGEADQEIEKADTQYSAKDGGQVPGVQVAESQAVNGERGIARRNSDMPDIESDAEDLADKTRHSQKEAEADIPDERARMVFDVC